uniref:Uncharacterized protein n=1 Tax=Peronospora matthiolae TaxID=2874970 RepID=A0AAV1T635_9STRA
MDLSLLTLAVCTQIDGLTRKRKGVVEMEASRVDIELEAADDERLVYGGKL